VDSFDFTIQRQLSRKVTLELGYIGRRITHEFYPIMLNTVPYMMTMGGQQFAQAYKNTVLQYCGGIAGLAGGGCAGNYQAVTPQPFFETALGGPTSTYCSSPVMYGGHNITPANCTQAVALNEGVASSAGNPNATANLSNAQVWSLWSDLDSGPFNFPHSMMNTNAGPLGVQMTSGPASATSTGFGNYNGGFASVKMADWRGLTMQSNFTWSKALGESALVQADSSFNADDVFNPYTMYGVQSFNHKFVFSSFFVYQPPFYKGQHGLMGHALGGWTFSSIFVAGSGEPLQLATSEGPAQEYGSADNVNYATENNAVPIGPVKYGHAYYNSPASGGLPVNLFAQGTAAINSYRNPILGLDNRDGGFGILTGLPYWNMDFSIKKNFRVTEGISLEFQGVFADVFNHNQWLDPEGTGLDTGAAGFGALPGSAQEQPGGNRQIEIAARVRF
jgi:hypothetical protein